MQEYLIEALMKAALPDDRPIVEVLAEAGWRPSPEDEDASGGEPFPGDLYVDRIETLGEGGFLTMDRGVAIYLSDGSAFTVSITRYRNPNTGF